MIKEHDCIVLTEDVPSEKLKAGDIGTVVLDSELRDIRRLYLERVRYHIYYRTCSSPARLEVLAVWHSSRGSGARVVQPRHCLTPNAPVEARVGWFAMDQDVRRRDQCDR